MRARPFSYWSMFIMFQKGKLGRGLWLPTQLSIRMV